MAEYYQLAKKALFQKVGDQYVILDSETGVYFTLDSIGTEIIELIQAAKTLNQIALVISHDYEVSEQTALLDITELVTSMEQEGLLIAGI